MNKSCGTDSRLSVVAIVTVADLPVMLDQIVDSCHSLALSGLCEAPVTVKLKLGQGDAHGLLPRGHVRAPQIISSPVASACLTSV